MSERPGWRARSIGAFAALLIGAGIAGGQDALKTLPGNYHVVFENDRVRVIRAHYGPHEKVPVHDHPSVATVFVYLNDSGQVRIDHAEEGAAPESVVRPPTKLGAYRVGPGLAERHSIENLGEVSSEFLRVEMKGATLGIKEPFRGKAPATLQDEDVVEFSDPAVRVERIVCVEVKPCAVKAEEVGSLVVAFGAATVAGNKVAAGGVFWVKAGETKAVTGDGGGAVHLLRIVLPQG